MKKLLILPFILFACNKKTTVQPTTTQPIVVSPVAKHVQIFVTFGAINNFCSVKWSFDPNIDSSYTGNNTYSCNISNYTTSDSILIYTTSHLSNHVSNTVLVQVDGVVKYQWTGIDIDKTIKL